MSEFLSSFSKWFSEKTSSPLYWTYFGFFIAWNWKFFQVVFLEDATLFSSPRIEYLANMKLNLFDSLIINLGADFLWRVGVPAFFTFLAIKYLPKIHMWAFNIYLDNYFARKVTYRDASILFQKTETVGLKEEKKERAKQEEYKKEIEKTMTDEERWEEEFKKIKRQDLLHGFQQLVGVLYKGGGVVYTHNIDRNLPNHVPIMTFAGTHDLVKIEKPKEGTPTLQLTDKGKYFSRLLTDKGIMAQ